MESPKILWTSEELSLYQRRFFRFLKEYMLTYDIRACGYTQKYKSADNTFRVVMYVSPDETLKRISFLEQRFTDLMSTVGNADIVVKVLNNRRSFEIWNMTLECKLVYDKEAFNALQLEQ